MIARTWRGAVRAEDADAYVEYLEETGLSEYRATPGNQGVYGLRRIDGDRCEFLFRLRFKRLLMLCLSPLPAFL